MRRSLIFLLLFLGAGALFGGWVLVQQPDGSLLHMSVELLAHSPFTTFFWPGLILFVCFGLGALVAAALLLFRSPHAPWSAIVIGVGQMIWIIVQILMIRQFHPFQMFLFITAAAILVLGRSLIVRR